MIKINTIDNVQLQFLTNLFHQSIDSNTTKISLKYFKYLNLNFLQFFKILK